MEKYKQYMDNDDYEFISYSSKEYANGGLVYNNPNAAIEKKEVVRYPDGSTAQANHGTHESGNDAEVNLPDGTQIFSDRLKDPTTKKTFAKMAEKYKIKDIDDKSTSLKKSTKELVDKIKQDKLNKIFQTQEALKQEKMNKYAQKLGYEFKHGGTKLPKYWPGGEHENELPPLEPVEDPSFNPQGYMKVEQDLDKDTAWKKWSNQNWDPTSGQTEKQARQQFNTYYTGNDKINQALGYSNTSNVPTSNEPVKKQFNPKTGNYDWIEPATNTLMQNMGNLMYLKDQGKKYDKQEFYKYSPELYNPADALRQADIEARVNRGRLKDATGGNAGALMSNLTQSQAINTLLKSKIRNDAANQNANTLNDAQVRNIQGKYNVDDINARNKGQALTNYYNAISGVGHNTSAAYRDWKRGDVDQQTLDIISKNYPDYVYDKRRKGWFHKSTGKQLQ